MGFEGAPIFHRHFHGEAVLDLGEVNEVAEIHREAEIAEHGFSNPRIATLVALVMLHHRGGDVEVFWAFGKFLDQAQAGKGLKPELRAEARLYIIVVLKVPAFMPD